MTSNYKTTWINGIKVSQNVKRKENSEKTHKKTQEEELCALIDSTIGNSDNNDSRFKKLNKEYKCSRTYNRSRSDPRPMPDCSNPIYNVLTEKFQKATESVNKVNNYLSSRHIDTKQVSVYAQDSINSILRLKEFTQENLSVVNAAFEKADYDTNTAGATVGFLTIFTGLGIFAAMANAAFYNNEFDGKIERGYNEAIEIRDNIIKIESIISQYSSDIRVD